MAINNDAKVDVISTRSPYAAKITFICPFYRLKFAFYANSTPLPFGRPSYGRLIEAFQQQAELKNCFGSALECFNMCLWLC